MRIIMISDHADPLAKIGSKESGGQNVYVLNVARRLAQRGHEVDIYTRWDRAVKHEVVRVRPGLRVVRVTAGPKAYMARDDLFSVIPVFVEEIKKRIANEGLSYDVIFSHYWFSGVIGLQLAKVYDLPQSHVYHSIGQIRYETLNALQPQEVDHQLFQLRNEWERRIAHECAGILTTSPVEGADICRIFEIDDSKLACIPIGVDLGLFRPRHVHSTRKKIGMPLNKQVILYVGRLEFRKGIATLIRALRSIAGAELFIVGSNKDERKRDMEEYVRLTRIAKETGVASRVHFVGAKSQPQIAYYYAAADVCAVPSYYEPFGIVPIEAMACGTPVVASRTGGMRFTVVDGVTGHLATPRDHKDLAEKLTTTLERGKLAYGPAARRHIEEHFSWQVITEKIADHLLSLSQNHLKKLGDERG